MWRLSTVGKVSFVILSQRSRFQEPCGGKKEFADELKAWVSAVAISGTMWRIDHAPGVGVAGGLSGRDFRNHVAGQVVGFAIFANPVSAVAISGTMWRTVKPIMEAQGPESQRSRFQEPCGGSTHTHGLATFMVSAVAISGTMWRSGGKLSTHVGGVSAVAISGTMWRSDRLSSVVGIMLSQRSRFQEPCGGDNRSFCC